MPFLSQAYQKGAAPKSRILPAGGKVLTSEEEYNLLSDRHFPDPLGELLSILSQDGFSDWLCWGGQPLPLGEGRLTLQGHWAASGDIFGGHSWEDGAAGMQWGEACDSVKPTAMHRTV